MFISEIKIDTYNIPLPEPVEAYAAGVMKSFDLVVCRIKNDDAFPILSIKECLRISNITIEEVSYISIYWQPWSCLLYTSPSPRD